MTEPVPQTRDSLDEKTRDGEKIEALEAAGEEA